MNTNNSNPTTKKDKFLSFKDVVRVTGLSSGYVRRAIHKGWLPFDKKVPINKNEDHFKYLFKESTIEAWREKVGSGARREDGRRKWNIYFTQEELERVTKLFKDNNIEVPMNLSNPPKEG